MDDGDDDYWILRWKDDDDDNDWDYIMDRTYFLNIKSWVHSWPQLRGDVKKSLVRFFYLKCLFQDEFNNKHTDQIIRKEFHFNLQFLAMGEKYEVLRYKESNVTGKKGFSDKMVLERIR